MRFRERLTPPLSWWAIGALVAGTFPIAVLFYLGPVWALGVAALVVALLVSILAGWAAVGIRMDDAVLHVGRAQIELRYLSGAQALDAAQTRSRSGVEADARAYLVLRPYIATAVEIAIDDPDDPVPYWLVSTRRPRALSSAIADGRSKREPGNRLQ